MFGILLLTYKTFISNFIDDVQPKILIKKWRPGMMKTLKKENIKTRRI